MYYGWESILICLTKVYAHSSLKSANQGPSNLSGHVRQVRRRPTQSPSWKGPLRTSPSALPQPIWKTLWGTSGRTNIVSPWYLPISVIAIIATGYQISIYFPHIGQHSLQRWSLIPFLHFSKDKINLKQVKLPTWCHKENKWQNQICSPDSDLTCVLSPLYSVVCSPPCYGQENPCWVSPWILPAVVGKNPFWHLVLVLEQFCFSGVPWEFLQVCSSVQLPPLGCLQRALVSSFPKAKSPLRDIKGLLKLHRRGWRGKKANIRCRHFPPLHLHAPHSYQRISQKALRSISSGT